MTNGITNSDVVTARLNMTNAIDSYAGVLLLPTEIGERVRWPHNGLEWERVAEDAWLAILHDGTGPALDHIPHPSRHIASFEFEVTERKAIG